MKKQQQENPQDRITKALDGWYQPSEVMLLSVVWAVSLYFLVPGYKFVCFSLLYGLGTATTTVLEWKAEIRGWLTSSSLVHALTTVVDVGLVTFFVMPVFSKYSWLEIAALFVQFFVMLHATRATYCYLLRPQIERFLGLPITSGGLLNGGSPVSAPTPEMAKAGHIWRRP